MPGGAVHRLVCLPHAGGSASVFKEWGSNLPGIEVQAVRCPGRAERIDERSPTDLHHLAFEIADTFDPSDERPKALFGHGMGALVALEAARVFQAGGTRLAHLFASGTRNAASYPSPAEAENLTTGAFFEHLVRGDHFYLHSEPPYAPIRKSLNVKITSRKDSLMQAKRDVTLTWENP
ncbi:thioesterase domain-containing protein [Streptomyces cinnabarinus]|uniref:Thioesterase domain-containing protein n=1 Tax=Streptomyces cinnabarinus TaxID=67287 RepID=A0ABY7KWP4_9ACTN|nr:thioesterase domain-containing protein [Streptomyces cinnabarinus]WAZ27319.1 thioesterase domain-containing protein [Streptomyces cinnabarinus]